MLGHVSKLVLRILRVRLLYSGVAIFGISVSVLTAGFVYMFVRHELSYDRFHQNAKKIYRVDSHFHMPESERPDFVWPVLSAPLIDKIRAELPGIAHSTRFMKTFGGSAIVQTGDDTFAEKLCYVDNDFFTMFSFELLKGNLKAPFQDKSSVILSESTARKYFGKDEPIGRQLTVLEFGEQVNYTVVGVVSDAPENSSISFQLLVPIESWTGFQSVSSLWNEHSYNFFVELKTGVDSSDFQPALDKVTSEVLRSIVGRKNSYHAKLLPLLEMHWYQKVPWDKTSNPQNIQILVGIVAIVIIIACANFVTLAVVTSSTRTTEIGLKKVFGASRLSIMLQFMYEAFVLTVLAAIVGLFMMTILKPYFDSVVGGLISVQFDIVDLAFLVGIVLLVSALAGAYPAFLFSSHNSGQILKGSAVLRTKSSIVFTLVLFQFALSLFIGACSLVMTRQMSFINRRDLGFEHDQIIVLPTFSTGGEVKSVVSKFKTEAQKEPLILSVASCSMPFFEGVSRMGFAGGSARAYNVDADFINTLGIELEEGRNFNAGSLADSQAVIINRQLANEFTENPLNDTFTWGLGESSQVIGITRDFNYQSLEFLVQPLFLTMSKSMAPPSTLLIKVHPENIDKALARIEAIFRTTNPDKPFQFKFLSSSVDKLYSSYRMWTVIINLANVFVTFIACVGLFGLAGIQVVNTYKEIGIRKAFGSTSEQIFYRIVRRYLWLILVAALIGMPLSYYMMTDWISQFAYRIDLTWQTYSIVVVIGLVVTLLAVGYHSLRGANLNPAETLKHRD